MARREHQPMIIKDYTPVFDQVTKELDPLASYTFGIIWRFAQMENGVCEASLQTLATKTGLSVDTIRRRIEVLMKKDYLSEKEYIIGQTRRLTPNYDVMHSMGLVRVAESNDPPSRELPPPLAESDTKIVIKETNKDTIDGMLELSGKHDKLDGWPPAHADLARPFCEFYRYPFPDERKNWVSQVEVWVSRKYTTKDVASAIEYIREQGWEYYQPSSILKAFGKQNKTTNDLEAENKRLKELHG